MLITLIIWLFIVLISLGYGILFEALLKKSFRLVWEDFHVKQVFYQIAIGFAILNGAAGLLSLLMPLSFWALFIISFLPIIACTITFWQFFKSKYRFLIPWQHYFLFFICFSIMTILVLYLTTGAVTNADTYIYHAQSIRWIEEFRVIKGLGNFFNRLSYNSNWFVQNALLSFSWVNGKSFHVLNGFLLWFANSFWLLNFFQAAKHNRLDLFKWTGIILVVIGILTLGSEASAPSTDMPTAYLVWLAAYFMIDYFQNQTKLTPIFSGVSFLVFSGVVKISIAPLFLMLPFILIWLYKSRKFRELLILLALSSFILVPWMFRNIFVSGYLVYPVPITGVDVAWRIPAEFVSGDARGIQAWGYKPRIAVNEVLSLPLVDRVSLWFNNITVNQRVIFLISLFSPLPFLVVLVIQHKKMQKETQISWCVVFFSFYIGLLFWLFTSPNLRFGYVYLLVLSSVNISSIVFLFLTSVKLLETKLIVNAVHLLLFFFFGWIILRSFEPKTINTRLITPLDYSYRSTYSCEINKGKTSVFCATDWGECGYHAFPCHAWGNDYAVLYGKDFLDGFYHQE